MDWARVDEVLGEVDGQFKSDKFPNVLPTIATNTLRKMLARHQDDPESCPEFQRLAKDFEKVDGLMGDIVDHHYSDFNSSITNFTELVRVFTEHQRHMKTLKANAKHASSLLVNQHRDMDQLWLHAQRNKEIMRLLERVEKAVKSLDLVRSHIKHGALLEAAELLTSTVALTHLDDMAEIRGLDEVRSQLAKTKQQLTDTLIDHLADLLTHELTPPATRGAPEGDANASRGHHVPRRRSLEGDVGAVESWAQPLSQNEERFARSHGWHMLLSGDCRVGYRQPRAHLTTPPYSFSCMAAHTALASGSASAGVVVGEVRSVMAVLPFYSGILGIASGDVLHKDAWRICRALSVLSGIPTAARTLHQALTPSIRRIVDLCVASTHREAAEWHGEVEASQHHQTFLTHLLLVVIPLLSQLLSRHLMVLRCLAEANEEPLAYSPESVWDAIQVELQCLMSEHFGCDSEVESSHTYHPEMAAWGNPSRPSEGGAGGHNKRSKVGDYLAFSFEDNDDTPASPQLKAVQSSLQLKPTALLIGVAYQPLTAFIRACEDQLAKHNAQRHVARPLHTDHAPSSPVAMGMGRGGEARADGRLLVFLTNVVDTAYLPVLKKESEQTVTNMLRYDDALRPNTDRDVPATHPHSAPHRKVLVECTTLVGLVAQLMENAAIIPTHTTEFMAILERLLLWLYHACQERYEQSVHGSFAQRLLADLDHRNRMTTSKLWRQLVVKSRGRPPPESEYEPIHHEMHFEGWPAPLRHPAIRDPHTRAQLATLSESLNWLADQVLSLALQSRGLSGGLFAAEQQEEGVSVTVRELCEQFRALANLCLLSLRVDLHAICYHRVHACMSDYVVVVDTQQPDEAITALASDLTAYAESLAPYLPPRKIRYVFSQCPHLIALLLMHHLKDITKINQDGVALMGRNVTALQLSLNATPQPPMHTYALDAVRQYYHLLLVSNEAFAKQHDMATQQFGAELHELMAQARASLFTNTPSVAHRFAPDALLSLMRDFGAQRRE